MRMKKLLIVLFAVSVFSAPELVAQMGFDFGMNFEFMNREAPDGYKARGFGMGPYAGIIYGIPVSMSGTVNVGLNYKFDILWGAPGATWDDKLLDPILLTNCDTDMREHHLQVPVLYNRSIGNFFCLSVGPVFDYCLSSKITCGHVNWPVKNEDGTNGDMDCLKDFGMKPFNAYLKAGAGIGVKGFSFKLTASYGILDLSPDGSGLRRWAVGMDFHLNL